MKKVIFLITSLLLIFGIDLLGQQTLALSTCETVQIDHISVGPNGTANLENTILVNTASYTNGNSCDQSSINWKIVIDIDDDGIIDLEYDSNLPIEDITIDDTNGNGIPDLYLPPTTDNTEQTIQLPALTATRCNHKITWQVSDDCNLNDVCVTSFSIEDKHPPTPFCSSNITVIFDGSDFDIYAQDLVLGSFDNCTPSSELRYSFSPDSIVATSLINCEDVINSPIDLDIYVWDENDNKELCTTTVNIIPKPTVDCIPSGIIDGYIKDWKNQPLENVEVTLSSNASEFPQTIFTNSDGYYTFGEQQNYLDYQVSVAYETNYPTGVTTLDLVLILRHIIGLQSFDNPCKIIAADINNDSDLKANDLTLIRKIILGIITELPNNTPWKFIYSRSSFGDQINTDDCELESIQYGQSPFTIDFHHTRPLNFIGIKIGDVN